MRSKTSSFEKRLTQDGSHTLYSHQYRQPFHSMSGAASEARHVFLVNSGVADRLVAGRSSRVLEIGFGAALNFLLTADCASKNQTPLEYTGLELHPVEPQTIRQLGYENLVDDKEICEQLLIDLKDVDQGQTSLQVSLPPCALQVFFQDARDVIKQLETNVFDAIYLDAFSPEANPELWTESFLAGLFPLVATRGKLVSYCVNRALRERLARVGFSVFRVSGPAGGKREVLVATN